MKDIEFRAWLKDEKRMVGVEEINFGYETITVDYEFSEYCFSGMIELMQFTGLYDKNGIKIFEGDVVKVKGTEIEHCVEFYEGGFVLIPIASTYSHAYLREYYKDCEVIGNIYDNESVGS